MENQLNPGVGIPPGSAGPKAQPSLLDQLTGLHDEAKAKVDGLKKVLGRFDALRGGFARLGAKADIVTPEDVIEEAGKLVGHGIPPAVLAGYLADMPTESVALAGWVAQQKQSAETREAQAQEALKGAQHELGVAALHGLQALSPKGGPGGGMQDLPSGPLGPPGPPNPLTAEGPPNPLVSNAS